MQSIIEHIVEEICKRCDSDHHVAVSADLAASMVRAVLIDPANHFQLERELRTEDVARLIALAVDNLCATNSPALETMKMQLAFESARSKTEREQPVSPEQPAPGSELANILEEILKSRATGVAALSALYRKILNYVIMVGDLGRLDNAATLKETNAALESIFPHVELAGFLLLKPMDKAQQLVEMGRIVKGIRLYNWRTAKGGSDVEDVPAKALAGLAQLSDSLRMLSSDLAQQLAGYTALLNHMQFNNARLGVTVDRLHEEIANRKQLLLYCEAVDEQVEAHKAALKQHTTTLYARINSIHALVESQRAVPTDEIYPRFVELAQLWAQLCGIRWQVTQLGDVLAAVLPYRATFTSSLDPATVAEASAAMQRFASPTPRASSAEPSRGAGAAGASSPASADGLVDSRGTYLSPEEVSRLRGMPALRGYCAWTLVYRDAMLLPGDAALGAVMFCGRYYLFTDDSALAAFLADPRRFLEHIFEQAERAPELAQLLALDDAMLAATRRRSPPAGIEADASESTGLSGSVRFAQTRPAVRTTELGTQTETHINPPAKDPAYTWNEWELRRKALMLTNLRTKRTHSSQTTETAFRRDARTQHYPPKDSATQSVRDNSTFVNPKKRFVAGLRGKPGAVVSVVDLTMPNTLH